MELKRKKKTSLNPPFFSLSFSFVQIVHTCAMSGLLKRKFEEVDEDPCYSSPSSLSSVCSGWDSEGESCYSDTLDSNPSNPGSPATSFSSEYAPPAHSKSRSLALSLLLC